MTEDPGRPRFHIAFPVDDLAAARAFYSGVLGCGEGRSSPDWVDFDLYGHQIVAHVSPAEARRPGATNVVDGHAVPVRHFGLVLDWAAWEALRDRLVAAGAEFILAPGVRFAGEAGEHATMFVRDPAGNALEFKAFKDIAMLFRAD